MQYYKVYIVKFSGDPGNPNVPMHTALFVETNAATESGFIHHILSTNTTTTTTTNKNSNASSSSSSMPQNKKKKWLRMHHRQPVSVSGSSIPETEAENREEDDDHWGKEYSRTELGVISAAAYPAVWDDVLRQLPGPVQQTVPFSWKTMMPDPLKRSRKGAAAPMMKSTEWTFERAIPALKAAGLLHEAYFWE